MYSVKCVFYLDSINICSPYLSVFLCHLLADLWIRKCVWYILFLILWYKQMHYQEVNFFEACFLLNTSLMISLYIYWNYFSQNLNFINIINYSKIDSCTIGYLCPIRRSYIPWKLIPRKLVNVVKSRNI